MSKIYIGIDNGTSGTIGIVGDDIEPIFIHVPIETVQDYTKKKQNVNRLEVHQFNDILNKYNPCDIVILMERPMINPTLFKASISANGCFREELAIIRLLKLKHMFVDSKDWQSKLLPQGTKGTKELKKASLDRGNQLFPQFREFKHPDRDGLLIAEYGRRNNL